MAAISSQPKQLKQNLFEIILSQVRLICNQLKIISLNRQIDVCDGLLRRSPLIDVAVLGQFKAGKSSFLNSLLGQSLLPVGVIPVTTVITRIQYGEVERANVLRFDGTNELIRLETLDEYISEVKNPGNRKDVEVVDITLPSLKDYPGLRFVDTPGLGSVYQYHMQTAEQWLPEVGAALLAISADRPLAEHDLALIRALIGYTPKIILLLTKADLLSAEQQQEVIQFFQNTLKRELNRSFPVFVYSTRANTEAFKHALETALLHELSTNREEELKTIIRHKIRSLSETCLSYLDIALQAATQNEDARMELHRQVLGMAANLTAMEEELIIQARSQAIHTRTNIDKYLTRFRDVLINSLTEQLAQEMPAWRGNLWHLTRRYEDWFRENLTSEISRISVSEHKHFFGTMMKAHAAFERYGEIFRSNLAANIEKTLGIKVAPAEWNMEVSAPTHPDIKIVNIFDFHFDLLWFLFPMFLFRKLFERRFMQEISRQVFVNLARLAAQWEERINYNIEDMRKQTMKYLREEITTVEALLSQQPDQVTKIKPCLIKLRQDLEILGTTQKEITG